MKRLLLVTIIAFLSFSICACEKETEILENTSAVVEETNNDVVEKDEDEEKVVIEEIEPENINDEIDTPIDEPVTEEYDYSAQHIMDLVEDTAFYAPSFKEEQIAAIVIGINLDHISDKDMDLLSEKYGPLEDLSQSYIDGLCYLSSLVGNYSDVMLGKSDNVDLITKYREEKIDFDHMVICKDYKEMAVYAENCYYSYLSSFAFDEDYDNLLISSEKNNSEEKALFDLAFYASGTNDYGIQNPYSNVLEIDSSAK